MYNIATKKRIGQRNMEKDIKEPSYFDLEHSQDDSNDNENDKIDISSNTNNSHQNAGNGDQSLKDIKSDIAINKNDCEVNEIKISLGGLSKLNVQSFNFYRDIKPITPITNLKYKEYEDRMKQDKIEFSRNINYLRNHEFVFDSSNSLNDVQNLVERNNNQVDDIFNCNIDSQHGKKSANNKNKK